MTYFAADSVPQLAVTEPPEQIFPQIFSNYLKKPWSLIKQNQAYLMYIRVISVLHAPTSLWYQSGGDELRGHLHQPEIQNATAKCHRSFYVSE